MIKEVLLVILKYSLILFTGMACIWYLTFYTALDVPEYIPGTPIKLYGLLIGLFEISLLIFAIKKIFHKYPTISIAHLTLCGALIVFVMEMLFQFVLSFTNEIDKLFYYVTGVIASTLFYAVVSFLIAFHIKTKRTNALIGMIIGCIVIFNIVTYLVKGELY